MENKMIYVTKNIKQFRDKNDKQIINALNDMINDRYLLKYIFYVRDIKKGLGERKFFRVGLKYMIDINKVPNNFNIVKSIVKYGRIDDLFILFNTKYEEEMLYYIKRQLISDIYNYKKGERISLLAKWLPSENASSKETKKNAYKIMKHLKLEPKKYRKILSLLRKKLDVVERKMCANEWNEININTVPKEVAIKRYKNAFIKHNIDYSNKEYNRKNRNYKNVFTDLKSRRYENIPLI